MARPLCVYCGKYEGVTDDHVPPRSLFPKPRPDNLVTVPACHDCNQGFCDDDEIFALFACLEADMDGPRQQALHEKVKRSVEKNQRFQRFLRSASSPIPLLGRDGSIVEYLQQLPWDSSVVRSWFERIVIGLVFHHYGVRVQQTGYVKISLVQNEVLPPSVAADLLGRCHLSHIGHEDEFIYRHGKTDDSPLASFWEFTLYRKRRVYAIVLPLV